MDRDGAAALTRRIRPFAVAIVETDIRTRSRMAQQVVGGGQVDQLSTLDELSSVLHPDTPTVAVFGPSLANEFGFEQLERLVRARPDVGVIVATRDLTTELLQHALRAGARDVVSLGGRDVLSPAIERVGGLVTGLTNRLTAATPSRLGRLILSFSTKGGVGKSVVSTNTAVGLAMRTSEPVAIIDADLQFGDVAVMLGLPPDHTVVDAAAAVGHGDSEFIASLASEHESGTKVLPAPVEPMTADKLGPEQMFGVIRAMQERCAYVVVDLPSHFDDLALALIDAADDVLVVASMDIPSIKNLKVGMQLLDLLSIAGPKLRLVLNRANSKVMLEIGDIEQTLGMKAAFQIPSDIAVPQAVNRGRPVVIDSPKSPAARGLDSIVTFLVDERGEQDGEHQASPAPKEKSGKKRRSRKRG